MYKETCFFLACLCFLGRQRRGGLKSQGLVESPSSVATEQSGIIWKNLQDGLRAVKVIFFKLLSSHNHRRNLKTGVDYIHRTVNTQVK